MRNSKTLLAILIALLALLALAVPPAGCGAIKGMKPVVGASGDGVSATCLKEDLPAGVSLSAAKLTEVEAAQAAALPEDRVFMAAADFAPGGTDTPGVVTLTFALDHQLAPAWNLAVYVLKQNSWQEVGEQAEISMYGHTVSMQVSYLGMYAFFLNDNWQSSRSGEQELATRTEDIPASGLGEETVLAAGKVDDPAVLAEVMQTTGYKEEEVRSLLRSWDTTGDRVVQVLQLTDDVYVTRYTSAIPADRLGRWYTPSEEDTVLAPSEARSELALPLSNPPVDCALYRVEAGTVVIYGICSDMSNQPGFGPDAVGGGLQAYIYGATRKIGDRIAVNTDTMELVSELRFVEGGE